MGQVDETRRELLGWVESHIPDLHRARHPSTLWYGVMQKCGSYVDELIRASAECLLRAVGTAADEALRSASNGKPFDQLTLGQRMKLLQALEKPLTKFMTQQPRLRVMERPLVGKAGVRLLGVVSRRRNDFAHGRWPADRSNEFTIEFLDGAKQLCNAPIIRLAVEIEHDAA